jgi:acyl-CoA reductase-like NAD-dependent aldehyde dehydrogenase
VKVLSPFVEKHRNLGKEIVHRLRERLSDLVFPLEPGDPLPQGTLPIRDPFTDEVFACVRGADKEIVFSSVEKARKAQVEFSSLPERKRGGYLTKIAEVLKRHRDLFELAEGLNVGLPKLISSRFSVSAMIRHYEYAGEWADKIYGTQVPTNDPKSLDFTLREPYGVVASLTAWNTPSLFLGSKVAYALAVGNTVLVKPSERSFLPALVFL